MQWTDYFDEIYLINLPENTGRLKIASAELNKYDIPFTVWPAIKHKDGKQGLNLTMKELFKKAKNKNNILVFEDDIKLLIDPNTIMPACVQQLKKIPYWDMFYMGLNMDNDQNLFEKFTDNNLLPVNFCFATHAVAYSYNARTILQWAICTNDLNIAFDVLINRYLGSALAHRYNRYCSFPLIASQQDGWSEIEGKESTYEYIPQRFENSVRHLIK